MPSSQSRSTHLERHLDRLYREASFRLYTAFQPQVNTFLVPHWCQVLDTSPAALASMAEQYWKPQFNGSYHVGKEEFEDEVKQWKQWAAKVRTEKPNQNAWDAAECLFDVGRCLACVGREGEGAEWGRLAEDLRGYACKL
ncbi:hypothetical protein LTR86_003730 [Recurvomyces mirabilis]|nr:hypothetical protein LTR86_003730 [Recurvomyces mirabilis]